MAEQKKLVDPVEQDKARAEAEQTADDEKRLDISSLSIKDFKAIRQEAARVPDPFAGYPFKFLPQTVKVGKKDVTIKINTSFIVALDPGVAVFQDPSGNHYLPGAVPKPNTQPINLETPHSRMIMDYSINKNVDVVFDRVITLADGDMRRCAVVPSHNVRAQIVFKQNEKTGKVMVDGRYRLLDANQAGRLRNIYLMLVNQNKRREQLADLISGGTDALPAGHEDADLQAESRG